VRGLVAYHCQLSLIRQGFRIRAIKWHSKANIAYLGRIDTMFRLRHTIFRPDVSHARQQHLHLIAGLGTKTTRYNSIPFDFT